MPSALPPRHGRALPPAVTFSEGWPWPRDHRRPARPGAARPARGCRLEEWPRRSSPHCPGASRGTSCASCGSPGRARRQGDQGRPRPPRVRPAAQPQPPAHAVRRALRRRERPQVRDGTDLDACLVTRHLQFSPLQPRALQPDAAQGDGDAAHRRPRRALVRLHLSGFWWGDVSLSNTLFRRDAGAFAAYLVDAETRELRERLSDGQREHDLEIARVNIAGELKDLEAVGSRRTATRSSSASRSSPATASCGTPSPAASSSTTPSAGASTTGSGDSTPSASTSTSSPSPPTSTARRSRSSPRWSTPVTTRAGCCG